MSDGGTAPGGAAEFAALLRELKERSGLSYGALAKRLHMSTSTLHRYCNGDAVPTDYAPVERLARLCKATPEDLVELHRRWVLADATRGRKAPMAATTPTQTVPAETAGVTGADREKDRDKGKDAERGTRAVPVSSVSPAEEQSPRGRRPRTRTAVVAGIAVAAVLGAVAFAVGLPSGGDGDGARAAGAASADGGRRAAGGDGRGASASPSGASPSAPESGAESRHRQTPAQTPGTPSASAPAGAGSAGDTSAAPPLTAKVEPYTWESPCSQRYLINQPPAKVPPPPTGDDATAWVAAVGAVSSGEQYVTLTLQGTGRQTVVLERMTIRTAGKRSPLAWNDYAMGYPGVGCGGNVPTRSFTVALDAARPAVVPEAGHRDFPFKVSESDPEVFYVKADASAYDVRWYLELDWSSGSRHGTLVLDDHGRPFRTSGNNGRPAYEFPLGGSQWVAEGTTDAS
ncbi:helix-turn-helix transcriptional regulator [Streptomyces sp. NPDC000987]|uniref:helix-turn-helix domain-containing protein n=1 Tax=Streptomyces sp. NPDC000987 TaxID=3154374 RepID=UPI00332848B4